MSRHEALKTSGRIAPLRIWLARPELPEKRSPPKQSKSKKAAARESTPLISAIVLEPADQS